MTAIETISMFDKNEFGFADELPRIHHLGIGSYVYFLFAGDEVVYVGETANIYKRIGEHLSEQSNGDPLAPVPTGKDFDSFSVIEVPEGIRLDVERLYIASLHPKFNHKGGCKHFHLTQRLARGGVL